MSVPASPPVNPFSPRVFLPSFLLGWGVGALLVLLVRWLGFSLLTDPCRWHTLLALFMPLLLGPGGFAFTVLNRQRPHLAAAGVGLMLASLFPALYLGTQDIGKLRMTGCAGGYVVIAQPGGKSISTLTIRGGETRELTGRIGGYTLQTHPAPFTLVGQSTTPDLSVTLPKSTVQAGETFPIQVTAKQNLAMNTFTAGVQATTQVNGKPNVALGTFGVEVRP